MTAKKKRCAICSNAYGTRYICGDCRKDPANKDWVETNGDNSTTNPREVRVPHIYEEDAPAVFDGARRDNGFSEVERAVALGLLMGRSNADIARSLDLTRERVRQIKDRFTGGKDIDVTQPNFSWMTEDSQRIIAAIGQNLEDDEIAESLDVDIRHVQRMRLFLEKATRRIPYDAE